MCIQTNGLVRNGTGATALLFPDEYVIARF